ncbi:MAG: alpha/beta fold hydrolase [Legionellales bacterium]|nr:alpha/beta fold hydrolase [Legionellales bacterium]
MPKIKVNDISMYYEIHGQGQPLVFIAGFSADNLPWQEITKKLAKKYQVILFDNRGAGQTDVPKGPYSIEQMASDVAELCKKLAIPKATFIGNSMGGYIVQVLAYQYPELVQAAVISNSAMFSNSCFRIYAAAQLELLKANAPIEAIIHASRAWVFSAGFLNIPGKLAELIQTALSNPYPFTITGYEAQYHALISFDSRHWAGKIAVPTLVLGSDQDIILPPRLAEQLAQTIPQASYYCFENCGHLPHIECPEKYVEVLDAFLNI